MTPAPVIETYGLGRAFGARVGVAGVNLALAAGQTLALVGANGGGKTTTLRMLAGLLRPDRGRATVLGQDLRSTGRRIAARAAYMSQRIALYPDLSVGENLRFRAALRGLPHPRDAWRETASRFGLDPWLERRCAVLSEGWARRVQLAATLLGAPPLVLLDEPTAGLDPVARAVVWDEVAAIARDGAAVVVSTHDVPEAASCGEVLILLDGTVAAQGAPDAVVARHGCASLAACLLHLAAQAEAA